MNFNSLQHNSFVEKFKWLHEYIIWNLMNKLLILIGKLDKNSRYHINKIISKFKYNLLINLSIRKKM